MSEPSSPALAATYTYPGFPGSVSGPPSLEDIERVSGVPESCIVYAFVYGSRLFGTAGPSSDWDVYVIVDGFLGPLAPLSGLMPDTAGLSEALIQHGNWDLNFYPKAYWQYLLDNNVIVTAVVSLFVPPEHVIKPSVHPFCFQLEFMKLKRDVDHYRGKHQEIFTKLFKKNRNEKALKIMVFVESSLSNSSGRVYDFESANPHTYYLRQHSTSTWQELEPWWLEAMNNLDQKFREITNEYKQSTPLMNLPSLLTHYSSTTSWKPPESKEHDESLYNIVSVKDHTSKAYIIDYLLRKQSEMNEYSWLRRDLSISVSRPFEQYPNLLLLHTLDTAPKCSLLAAQCKGVILDESHSFSLVALPFFRFASQDDDVEQTVQLDWSSVLISEKLNGLSFTIFYYSGSWHASYLPSSSPLKILSAEGKEDHASLIKLFWETWEEKEYELPPAEHKTYSLLLVPSHPISLLSKHRIIFLAARNMITLEEDIMAPKVEWETLPLTSFSSLPGYVAGRSQQEYINLLTAYTNAPTSPSPFISSGYVAFDPSSSHRYVCQTKVFQSLCISPFASASEKRRPFLNLLLLGLQNGMDREQIAMFPQWQTWFCFLWSRLHSFCSTVEELYRSVSGIEGEREFSRAVASQVVDRRYHPFLYSLRKRNCSSVLEELQDLRFVTKIEKALFP